MWQFVILSGDRPGRHNQFPICRDRARYWCPQQRKDGTSVPSTRDRRLRGVSEEFRVPVDAAQPYHAGRVPGRLLACLNDLANFDKHRVIQAAFSAVCELSSEHFEVASLDEAAVVEVSYQPWQRVENRTEIVKVRVITSDPDANVRMKANVPIAIDPRRRHGRLRPHRPARPPRPHHHPQRQELPAARDRHRTRARGSGSGPPALRLNRDSRPLPAHYSLPTRCALFDSC